MKKQIANAFWVVLLVFAAGAWMSEIQALAREADNGKAVQNISAKELRTRPISHLAAPLTVQAPSGALLLQRPEDNADQEDLAAMFQADVNGNLVLNEKTRLNIEKLSMLNTSEELKVKFKVLSGVLPPAAHRQLVRLTDAFQKYISAVIKKHPPNKDPQNLQEVTQRHEGIHDLRVTYFGAEATEAFWGKEEKFSRRIFEIMKSLDESIPLPERAHMAQEILKKETMSRPQPSL